MRRRPRSASRGLSAGGWVLLPQAVSRLSALYVFALAARVVEASDLGVLAIGTAAGAAAFGITPAVVGKPLAAMKDDAQRCLAAPQAASAAVLLSLPVAALLCAAALVTVGTARLTLLACSAAVIGSTLVEAQYWRVVFEHGRRRAGVELSAAFVVQGLAITLAVTLGGAAAVVLAPFAALVVVGAVSITAGGGLTLSGARGWMTAQRHLWLPYVWGVTAGVVLVTAVPLILASAAGLEAAAGYRALELLFGATNLLLGVAVRALLTEDVDSGRAYRLIVAPIAFVAVLNGVGLVVLPLDVVEAVVGSAASMVTAMTVVLFTAQRALLSPAHIGGTLLVRARSARDVGALGACNALVHFLLLVAGARWAGLSGGLAGLAVAEAVAAVVYTSLVHSRETGSRVTGRRTESEGTSP